MDWYNFKEIHSVQFSESSAHHSDSLPKTHCLRPSLPHCSLFKSLPSYGRKKQWYSELLQPLRRRRRAGGRLECTMYSAPSTSNTTLPSTTTPPTQHSYVHYILSDLASGVSSYVVKEEEDFPEVLCDFGVNALPDLYSTPPAKVRHPMYGIGTFQSINPSGQYCYDFGLGYVIKVFNQPQGPQGPAFYY